jgi:hypothetical protein
MRHSRRRNDHALVSTRDLRRLDRVRRSDEAPRDNDGEHDDKRNSQRELKDLPDVRDLRVHVFRVGIVTAPP